MVKRKEKAKKGSLLSKLVRRKVKGHKKSKKKVGKMVKRVKKAVKKTSKADEGNFEIGFEEVVIRCGSCGREFRIVKSSGFSTEGMLCQRCAAGGGMGFEEDSDF